MAEVTFGGGSTVIPRRSWTEEGFFAACDLTSYSYFTLAVFLFTLGTIVTVFALDVGTATLFASLGHMWLVGPIFICSGLMVAVRTVLYLRKKNMMNFVVRQHAMFRELQGSQGGLRVVRNVSSITLPPSYDSAVSPMLDDSVPSGGKFGEEIPPPSYEEALLLVVRGGEEGEERLSHVAVTEIFNGDNSRQATKGDNV